MFAKKKDDMKKPRRSIWYRIWHYRFEPPKKVVMKGDGTIKLVPLFPETGMEEEIIKKPALSPSETSVIEEVVEEIKEEIVERPPAIKRVKKKSISVVPEPVVREKIREKVKEEVPEVTKKLPVVGVEEKIKKGLEKTRGRFWARLKSFFSLRRKIDEEILEELEDILIGADVGAKPVHTLIQEIREAWKAKSITETSQIRDFIKNRLSEDLRLLATGIHYAPTPPTVIMVVGVNGVGKTTSIAKLANIFIKDGRKVMVAAGDTFRAAAADQLEIWSKRIGADIIKHQAGSDPAAVAYDALDACLARNTDILIVDTAGRLHTHENLMKELAKIKRVISNKIPGAPHEVLMVLDATTGQNAIAQAKSFKNSVDVSGIFLAKLDGTAKGGIVLGMRSEINIPVKFIGLGEKEDDIAIFDPDVFVNALLEE
ncbi:MAG: signal recognition particle-docking protein FtsY [Candidatus Brocadiaceae bacterium]|nr:signal recognition particle-docking protein FtsY [Candidatus Brocadiaceae bacterium]